MSTTRKVVHPLHLNLDTAVSSSNNGSFATFSTDNAPVRIPPHAKNATASLAGCTIPATDLSSRTDTVATDEQIEVVLEPPTYMRTNPTDGEGRYQAHIKIEYRINGGGSTHSSPQIAIPIYFAQGNNVFNNRGLHADIASQTRFCQLLTDALNTIWQREIISSQSPFHLVTRNASRDELNKSTYSKNASFLDYEMSPYITFRNPRRDETDPKLYMNGGTSGDYISYVLVRSYIGFTELTEGDIDFFDPGDGGSSVAQVMYVNVGREYYFTPYKNETLEPQGTITKNVTIPAGDYRTPGSFQATLNNAIVENFGSDYWPLGAVIQSDELMVIREHENTKKWQLGAYLTGYKNTTSWTPRSIVINATQASAPGICALLGDDSSDVSITLQANSTVPTTYSRTDPERAFIVYDHTYLTRGESSAYDDYSYPVKTLMIESNIVQAGRNILGSTGKTLAIIPVEPGVSTLTTSNASDPVKVDLAPGVLQSDTVAVELALKDQDGNLVSRSSTASPWTMEILVEWEEAVKINRLTQRDTETKFR